MVWSYIATGIIWIIMFCAVLGLIGAIRDPDKGVGREFNAAFNCMGTVFIPFAGMLAAMPYIEKFVLWAFGGLFEKIGADVAVAGALIVAPDMGGYQLANSLAASPETWIIAVFVSYLAGPILGYTIPIGFAMLDKRDYKYFGLGTMAGLLSIPFGVFAMITILKYSETPVRGEISNVTESSLILDISWYQIFINLLPLAVFCIVIAILLKLFMDIMVKGFLIFGRGLEIAIKVVLVLAIVEYFTGLFSTLFGDKWLFDPIIADAEDQFRALENAGYVVLMLSGAYPMVYLLKKYLSKAATKIGEKVGFSGNGIIALMSSWAEIILVFGLFNRINPADKVKVIAFTVCGSWLIGAHLSFTANFQPNLTAIIFVGKIVGAIIGIFIAMAIAVPAAKRFEKIDREKGIIGKDEYINDDLTAEEIEELTKN